MLWRIWLRRGVIAAAALAVTWFSAIAVLSIRYVNNLLNPPCPSGSATPPLGFQNVEILLENGTQLKGWWHPPENSAAVVLMGGHGSSRDGMLPEAHMLAAHGYGALTMDYRNCAGQPTGLGAWEVDEFDAALDYVFSQPKVEWIAALGFSAGGSAVVRGSVERPEVRAVIAEGHYANLWEEIKLFPPAPLFSLTWQLQRATALILWVRLGVWPGEVSPIDALPELPPRPLLLIFGEKEAVRVQAEAQFQAAQEPKALWIVPGADHGEYAAADSAGYERRLIEFLEQSRRRAP